MITKFKFPKYMVWSLIGLIVIACGDDNGDVPGVTTDSLVGTWNVTLIEITGTITGFPVNDMTNPTGTITFNADFTGKENYSYTIPGTGIPIIESDAFTWISNTNTITFDPGDVDESQWTREVNQASLQRGNYRVVATGTDYTITITIEK